jgi:hypothetical protein
METERKRLEEIMAALPLCFLGRGGEKCQEAVAQLAKELADRTRLAFRQPVAA